MHNSYRQWGLMGKAVLVQRQIYDLQILAHVPEVCCTQSHVFRYTGKLWESFNIFHCIMGGSSPCHFSAFLAILQTFSPTEIMVSISWAYGITTYISFQEETFVGLPQKLIFREFFPLPSQWSWPCTLCTGPPAESAETVLQSSRCWQHCPHQEPGPGFSHTVVWVQVTGTYLRHRGPHRHSRETAAEATEMGSVWIKLTSCLGIKSQPIATFTALISG